MLRLAGNATAQRSRRKWRREQHTASEECATCHMPKRRTEDVVHVVMTDHLIQRRPPTRDLLAEMPERHPTEAEEYHGEVVPYYPKPLPATDENKLYRAVAQVALKNNLKRGHAELARETARCAAARVRVLHGAR